MNPFHQSAEADHEWQVQEGLLKALIKAKLVGTPEDMPRLGRFELVRELGHGAAGAVYLVRDLETGGELALKLLRAPSAHAIQAFKQEFRGLTHVVHENLVQLHELFADGAHWYFTMELVRGVRFTQHVRRPRSGIEELDYQRVTDALVQLLSGVQAIHGAGKLHCDLKPSNVIVTDSGRVVVLDFGLLASRLAVPHAGESGRPPAGSPPYMAPELERGHAWTAGGDAYAVGVMLLEALTGHQAFAGAARAWRSSAQRVGPGVPEELEQVCAGLLDPEPGTRMSIEQALSILPRARPQPSAATTSSRIGTRIVGRERELAALHDAFAETRRGKSIVVFVRGCSGIGKSALAARFADELQANATVLRSACYQRESLVYKAFDGLVDALAALLAALPRDLLAVTRRDAAALLRIFPALGACLDADPGATDELPRGSNEQRQLAFAALKELLRRLAEHQPLVLIADDLQWADLDSAQLLIELLGPPNAPALLYVGCYRSEEEQRSDFLREICQVDSTHAAQAERRHIDLEPFDAERAAAMAMSFFDSQVQAPELIAARIARESGGIPFFVRELTNYFVRTLDGDSTALSLADLLARRLTELTQPERRVLELLAFAGRPIAAGLLGYALDDVAGCSRSLRVLSALGLVNADAHGKLVVYHDRLRELIVRSVPGAQAKTLHRLLAQAYEGTKTAEPEWLIEHWREAEERERAFEYAVAGAAQAAAKLAFNRAAELYGAALELHEGHDARRRELFAAQGEALVNAGHAAEAARALLSAAEGAAADVNFALQCRAAQQYLRCGRLAEATELLQVLFHAAGHRYPESHPEVMLKLVLARGRLAVAARWALLGDRAGTQQTQRRSQVLGSSFREFMIADPMRGLLLHSLYYENALRTGDPEAGFIGLAWATYNDAFLTGMRGRHKTARRLERLDELAQSIDTPYAHATALFVRGAAALWSGDYQTASTLTSRAQTIFREQCLGAVWEESTCALLGYSAIENVGPLQKLCDEAPSLVRRADERKDQLSDSLVSGYMASALLVQDRATEAVEFMKQRANRASPGVGLQVVNIGLRLTDTLIYAGDGVQAWETCQRLWPAYLRSGGDRVDFLCMMSHLRRANAALLANAALKDRSLERIVSDSAMRLERLHRTDASGIAASIRAGLLFQQGRLRDSRKQMRLALTLISKVAVPVAEECYRLQLGRITGGTEGAQMIAQATAALRSFGVVSPERWATWYVTGFAHA